jgi:hypothetical protein
MLCNTAQVIINHWLRANINRQRRVEAFNYSTGTVMVEEAASTRRASWRAVDRAWWGSFVSRGGGRHEDMFFGSLWVGNWEVVKYIWKKRT